MFTIDFHSRLAEFHWVTRCYSRRLQGDRLSRCASEIARIRQYTSDQCEDIELFFAPHECNAVVARGEAKAIAASLAYHGFTPVHFNIALLNRITCKQALDLDLIVDEAHR